MKKNYLAVMVLVIFSLFDLSVATADQYQKVLQRRAIGKTDKTEGSRTPDQGQKLIKGLIDIIPAPTPFKEVFRGIFEIAVEDQKRLNNKKQVEQEYYQETQKEVVEPTAILEQFSLTPQSVQPGQKITVKGRYVLMGPSPATPPSGTMKLLKKGNPPIEKAAAPMKEVNEGRLEFTREIILSNDLMDGEYELAVEVVNGDSVAQKSHTFTVARVS